MSYLLQITSKSIKNRNLIKLITNHNLKIPARSLSTESFFTTIALKSNEIFQSLSQSYPVYVTQEFLINMNDFTGLPWYGTIILSTFVLRSCITLPLAAYQNNILAKLENLGQNEMPKIAEELKLETKAAVHKFKWTKEHAMKMYQISVSLTSIIDQ